MKIGVLTGHMYVLDVVRQQQIDVSLINENKGSQFMVSICQTLKTKIAI